MDKIALITGCNRGIGKATMELFIQNGISVIACTRILSDSLTVYYKSLEEKYNVKIYPIKCDLSDEDSIKTAMKEVYALKIPIDILVNNAGITRDNLLMRMSEEEFDAVIAVNLKGTFNCMKQAARPMMKQKYGKIINMASVVGVTSRRKAGAIVNLASIAGIDSTVGNCGYGASKAAMILSTKVLARELSVYNIRVNAVAPGFIDTDIQSGIDRQLADNIINNLSIRRLGTPEEVAKVILFLASDQASYVNGQVIRIDGGM